MVFFSSKLKMMKYKQFSPNLDGALCYFNDNLLVYLTQSSLYIFIFIRYLFTLTNL